MQELTLSPFIMFEGKNYFRDYELLGDVEKVRWYYLTQELSEDYVGYETKYNIRQVDTLEELINLFR